MKVTKRKAKGVLADMIANIDEDSLAKTRDEMIKITEDYCSPKVSKLLRDKGLGQEHFHHYVGVHNDDGTSEAVSVCTHQIAMKFLREQKNIAILPKVHTNTNGFCWGVSIINLNKPYEILKYFNTFDRFEDSVEAALEYVLENLI